MKKLLFFFFLLFSISTIQKVIAQENKMVILNLKTGYSVKGEIIEQTTEKIRIKTINGEIFEYNSDEIESKSISKVSKEIIDIPLIVVMGDKLIGFGIGLINNLEHDKYTFPNIPITFEYVLKDDLLENKLALGVGGYFGYCASKDAFYDNRKNSKFLVGARGYAHYALIPKFDTYSGIFLGYKNVTDSFESSDFSSKEYSGSFTANLFIGGRYFFNEKIAGMAELGWGLSVLTLGVVVKL